MKRRRAWWALFFFALLLVAVVTVSMVGFSLYREPGADGIVNISTSTTISGVVSTATTLTISTTTILSMPTSTIPTLVPTPIPAPIVYPSGPLSDKFGMAGAQALIGLDSADVNARLNDIASLGIGWIRFDIQWDYIQPNNSTTYNWKGIDQLVAAANAHHIKMLAILDYTPAWARSSKCTFGTDACLPANPAQFAAFAKAAVARYAPEGISDWEIWNEPNLAGDVPPGGNASAYATLLKLTYTAIKSQNRAAFVLVGGLAPAATADGAISPIDFLSQLYADGDKNYFDAVGFHPYSFPAMPSYYATWNAWEQMASTTPSLRSVMVANGDESKQIWMTEYGAPTGGPGLLESSVTDTKFMGHPDHVTEAVQAAMFAQAITLAESYPWAGPLFFYSYKDNGTSTSTSENFFGIIRHDGTEKPAYITIKDLIGP